MPLCRRLGIPGIERACANCYTFWVELSVRYGLALDPFDAHDNIFAGAAYLKDMHDGFGSAGFLSRRDMNSTSRQTNRFHLKPQPTSPRSRHCSVTNTLNT